MRLHVVLLSALYVGSTLLAACVGNDPGATVPGPNDGPDGSSAIDGAASSGDGGPSGGNDSGVPACGAVGTACCAGNTCSGGAQCNGTICACPANQTACGSSCVDTKNEGLHCGRCSHDCLGGACSNSKCSAYTVTPSQPTISRIFVDGARMYWTRGISSLPAGGFYSARLDGTDLVTVFSSGPNGCYAATTGAGKAYFTCSTAGSMFEIRQCTLPCGAGSSMALKSGIASASGLAVNPATGTVYYAVPTSYNQLPNGGIFDTAGNRVGSTNQPNPVDLVIANGSLYWLNGGTYTSDSALKNGGLVRASLASLGTEVSTIGSGGNYYDNSTLTVDANNVYYSGRDAIENDADVVVGDATATGAAPTVFAEGVGSYVASDGTNVFFTEPATNSVRYCSRTAGCGSGKSALALNELDVLALSFDTKSVFWAKFTGEIRRIAKP